jgi:hypothetical protein
MPGEQPAIVDKGHRRAKLRGFFSPTRHSTEADRPISRVRDIVDALAKATIEAIPRDPYAARGFPGRHPP